MGYRGTSAKIPFDLTGFTYARDSKSSFQTALVDGTRNINFHEGGIGKRGGTSKDFASPITGTPAIRGLYQFRDNNGTDYKVFGTSAGNLYNNNEAGLIKTGLSTNNYFNFSVFDNQLYIADGASVPQVWTGGDASTVAISGVATDWSGTSDYPFQIISHSRGANARMWAIRRDAVYASKALDGDDFSDGQVKKIPVYTDGGIIGGVDFGSTLFVFSKTRTYLIDDTNSDTALWGYEEAIWEGGAAHWRLIVKAANNIFIMTEDGTIYSLKGVQATGDYEQANLTRPAHIDRFFREKVNLSNINNFHATYDRNLRAIKWFVQVAGSNTNTAVTQFIDRPPELAWVIHDNGDYSSGYNAGISSEFRIATGDFKIKTGDFSGDIWTLEDTTKADEGNPVRGALKTKTIDFGQPKMYKHFRSGRIRAAAEGNFDLVIRVFVDGIRKNDINMSLSGSGATFGEATFGTSVFAEESIEATDFELGYYGFDIQFEVFNETVNEDFFVVEMLIDFKPLGVRV